MRRILKYIVLLVLISSCSTRATDQDSITLIDGGEAKNILVCELDESINFLNPNIGDVRFLSDTSFIVSNENQLSIHNIKGSQIGLIKKKTGRARGEFGSTGAIDIDDGNIYLWCMMSLKLIKYDKNGEFLDQYDGFKKAIRSFRVVGDDVYFYGIGNRKLFNVYNMKDRGIIEDFDDASDAIEILKMNSKMSCISEMNDGIIYTDPVTMITYFVKSNTLEELFRIEDKNYISQEDVSVSDVMHPPYDKALEYLTNNSTIVGVHSYNDKIYIVAENYDEISQNERIKRNLMLYIVSEDKKEAEYVRFDYPKDDVISRICFNKNNIYYLSTSIDNGVLSLNKIDLSK